MTVVVGKEIEKILSLPKKKKNKRETGLKWVREVRDLLIDLGHEVEGPNFKPTYIPGKDTKEGMVESKYIPVHKDFFGVFDLISHKKRRWFFQQISILEEKSRKIDAILEKGMDGIVWGRTKNGRFVDYRIFRVQDGKVDEIVRGDLI